ncbi:MAG TPA: RHS repeat-associated core domain-containing protein [Solirubrobacteraceae bacterium]|nr:RHS repeat-associated core domain-containing protein [Solirubrobacteraceae bacterium]
MIVAVLLVVAYGATAVAVACEGTGGPPTSPNEEEKRCDRSAPNLEYFCLGKPVNNATGDETEEQTDISVGGRGPGLRIVRTYDAFNAAKASSAGVWGYGWSGPYSSSLSVSGEVVTIHEEDGGAIDFYKSGTGYTQGGWDEARLEKSGTSYIYTLPEQTVLEFNSEGKLVKETDENGNSNTLTYKEGKLEKVEDGAKRTLTFKYNGEGLVESIKDPMGHTVSYTYAEKQLASVTIEGKERWKYEYESHHLLKKITDGRSHATTIKYAASEPYRVTEEEVAGHKRKWEYKTSETKITEPNGSETLEVFNSAGEPTKITRAKGKSEETSTEYEYNAETYSRKKMKDPNGHVTEYTYDEAGNNTSEKDPAGDETKWEYDTKHNVKKETSPEGEVTTIELNSKGEPTKIERPAGSEKQITEYKYASNGDLEEETNPLKDKTKYTYDEAGDKATETDPEGDERKWKYNEDSQVTEETSPRGYVTKTERDERGLPTKITDPLGHTTEYAYDGNSNIESETDGNGHTTKYEYNEENLRTKTTEPNGTVVETGYDAEGQMTSHTDGEKHTWEYKRNALEQVTEEKNPLEKVWKKTYEKAGNLQKVEDPEAHTTEYTYDNSSRLEKIKYSTGKPSEVTYEYNKDSKVTKMKDETGTTENTWDKLDRLAKYKNGAGKTVEYEYNLDNQPTKITYPNGKAVTREYDKAGRLEKITDWKERTTSFKYNKDSELTNTTFPSASEDEDTYGYNEADQMTEVKMAKGVSTLAKLAYERDNDGQVKKTTTTGLPGPATSESILDENNRLIEAQSKAYKYNKANDPEKIEGEAGYTYNSADELEKGGGNTYAYNNNGQRTETEPEEAGRPTTTYTYSQASSLTAVERPEHEAIPKIEDKYTYDGNNLLQAQKDNGTETKLTWETAEPLPVVLEDETDSYIYGPEDLPVEQVATSGGETTLYLHHDQQGSTRLLTNTSGEKETAYTYSPYGKTFYTEGTATTPLRYDAQYTSTNTGLIYLRARWYDSDTAQFLSVDPVLETTGAPYAYAGNNPENGVDPSGACQTCQEGAGSGGSGNGEPGAGSSQYQGGGPPPGGQGQGGIPVPDVPGQNLQDLLDQILRIKYRLNGGQPGTGKKPPSSFDPEKPGWAKLPPSPSTWDRPAPVIGSEKGPGKPGVPPGEPKPRCEPGRLK